MAGADESGEFWFNVATKQIEQGHQSSSRDLMGPYPTREAAAKALEQAAARNQAWDAQDERDKG